MAQLRSLGETDPTVQARLMDDLRKTDPSLWPVVMQTYRTNIAYQQRLAKGAATQPAVSLYYETTTVPNSVADARQASATALLPAAQNCAPAFSLGRAGSPVAGSNCAGRAAERRQHNKRSRGASGTDWSSRGRRGLACGSEERAGDSGGRRRTRRSTGC